MSATEGFEDGFVIHAPTLSNVAQHGNMICSALPHIIADMSYPILDSPGGRLRWAREQAGFKTAKDFSQRYGLKDVTYRAYENDQNGFASKANELGDWLGVTGRWLLEGGDIDSASIAKDGSLELQAKEMGLTLVPELELGYSMGGGSIFNEYVHKGFIPFHREWLRSLMRGTFADLFVARGTGDSMMPTLLDGDLILIDTAQKRIDQQDRIWALSYGDLGMVKRVRRLPSGTYRMMSDNPTVTAIDASDDEMYVVGRVVWIGRTI